MELISHSLEETKKIASDFLLELNPDPSSASVVALSGDLGSGKTAFVQACAELLGVKEKITSPTFVIMKKYKLTNQKFNELVHIDAYRLKNGGEIKKIGFDELLTQPERIIFIEWPENIDSALPKVNKKLSFKFVDQNKRQISL